MTEEQTITNDDTQPEATNTNKPSPAEDRIKQLSDKVELTAKERDEKEVLLKERDEKIAVLEKEKAFSESFAEVLDKQPNAKEHKDAIKEKVDAGYSVEDATYAVLGKAGALAQTPAPEPENPAGGSASTTLQQGEKSVSEMTQDERRQILEKELIID